MARRSRNAEGTARLGVGAHWALPEAAGAAFFFLEPLWPDLFLGAPAAAAVETATSATAADWFLRPPWP